MRAGGTRSERRSKLQLLSNVKDKPMFDKLSHLAEQTVTHASRRQFLGRLGQGALALATTMSAVLAAAEQAQARGRNTRCCHYRCASRGGSYDYYVCRSDGTACPTSIARPTSACRLHRQRLVASCASCG
jgi:hypothetical protein